MFDEGWEPGDMVGDKYEPSIVHSDPDNADEDLVVPVPREFYDAYDKAFLAMLDETDWSKK